MSTDLDVRDARDRILHRLSRVQRRMRLLRLARRLAVFAVVSLVAGTGLTFWRLAMPVPSAAVTLAAVVWLVLLSAIVAWTWLRREPLVAAARSVDRLAGLKDELKSAHWFAGQSSSSEWVVLHLHRAAGTAAALDISDLYPVTVPRGTAAIAAITVALVLLNFVPTSWTRQWMQVRDGFDLSAAERAGLEDVRDVLAAREAPGELAAERILDRILGGAMSPEEVLRDLRSAQALLPAPEAAGRARSDSTALEESADDPGRGGERRASTEPGGQVGRPPGENEPADRAEESRQIATAARAQLEAVEASIRDRAARPTDERGNETADQGSEREGQDIGATAGLGAGADRADQVAGAAQLRQSERLVEGALSGPADIPLAEESGVQSSLDVRLRPEVLPGQDAAGRAGAPDESRKESRAATSRIPVRNVEGLREYAEAAPLTPEPVPPAYRALVRSYFRTIGPRRP